MTVTVYVPFVQYIKGRSDYLNNSSVFYIKTTFVHDSVKTCLLSLRAYCYGSETINMTMSYYSDNVNCYDKKWLWYGEGLKVTRSYKVYIRVEVWLIDGYMLVELTVYRISSLYLECNLEDRVYELRSFEN